MHKIIRDPPIRYAFYTTYLLFLLPPSLAMAIFVAVDGNVTESAFMPVYAMWVLIWATVFIQP